MTELDESALTAAALLVEPDDPTLEQRELDFQRRLKAARIIETYLATLGRPEYLKALEFAARIADAHSDLLLSRAGSWAVANEELAGRYTEATRACDEVAMKIRDEARRRKARQLSAQ